MCESIIIGVDLAKSAFQVHGATRTGAVLFRKKLSRDQFQKFILSQSPCIVAMEACSSSHYWARVFSRAGHEVRLVPPIYVKPFVKRQKNDMADAEAIGEAALRPSMRFVEHKSADDQALTMLVRTRDQLVNQRTDTIIPASVDPNRCAHFLNPMDMMVQGCSMRRFHAWQQSERISS